MGSYRRPLDTHPIYRYKKKKKNNTQMLLSTSSRSSDVLSDESKLLVAPRTTFSFPGRYVGHNASWMRAKMSKFCVCVCVQQTAAPPPLSRLLPFGFKPKKEKKKERKLLVVDTHLVSPEVDSASGHHLRQLGDRDGHGDEARDSIVHSLEGVIRVHERVDGKVHRDVISGGSRVLCVGVPWNFKNKTN